MKKKSQRDQRDQRSRRTPGGQRPQRDQRPGTLQEKRVFKKRPCRLCKEKINFIDFKDTNFLNRFVSDRGRIIASRITGNCAKHQRMVSNCIKRARLAALLPYIKIKEGLIRRRFVSDRDRER